MSQKTIKNLLDQTGVEIEVAVVLSCHSEYIGKLFQNAGIQHVVCVGREWTIQDEACITFAHHFYTQLFSYDNNTPTTVCQAFEIAKTNVKIQSDKGNYAGEEHKFRCLHGHGKQECPSIDTLIKYGQALNMSPKPQIKALPIRVKNLVGRAKQC